MKQGLWSVRQKFIRCSGDRKCSACLSSPESKPHGPYATIRRRKPLREGYDELYLGVVDIDPITLKALNRRFGGRDKGKPERHEVLEFIRIQKEIRHATKQSSLP